MAGFVWCWILCILLFLSYACLQLSGVSDCRMNQWGFDILLCVLIYSLDSPFYIAKTRMKEKVLHSLRWPTCKTLV